MLRRGNAYRSSVVSLPPRRGDPRQKSYPILNKLLRFTLLLLVFQIVVSSCASTKRRDDQSALAKLWHNTNSHYNGYFNARELMTETLLQIDENHVDNYTQRLDMFPFLELENTSSVAENLDIAIEKVALVVKKHPYSNWVDDSYLLIGQAQLIKQDYESAEKTLRFMVSEFRPRPKRRRGKVKAGEQAQEEEEFVSRRAVEVSDAQRRKDRLRARKEAEQERAKLQKERRKAAKARKKQREKDRKERIRARKKGIRLPSRAQRDTAAVAGLENEPDPAVQEEQGPVGMISIFNRSSNLENTTEAYGTKPDSYLIKHRPAHQEGRLWLAWTLIKRDNFDRAQLILEDLRADRGTFPEVRRKAMAVQAFLYLEQDLKEEAIPYLEQAAEVAKNRNERARFYYIAGQLQQELGQPAGAAAAFEQTIAARPDYQLELGARLNLAQNGFLSGTGTAADALGKLERMAKEDKNIPYEAQIYYAMAALALRDGDEALGAKYLQRSLASPSAGPAQRVEAYSLLGNLAYEEGDYLSAKLYYDTTLTVMQPGDLRYETTSGRRDQLTGISEALTDISLKDSLLRIGTLPEAQRQEWATNLFEAQRKARLRPIGTAGERPGGPGGTVVAGAGDFWAYNPQILKRGKRDFERNWGDRPLTDNWRRSRSNEASGGLFDDPDDGITAAASEENAALVTEDEIAALLKDIPTEEADQDKMRIQLATNWFNLGKEYRDRLEDNEKALEAFETLNRKYPGANGEAESFYYQYLIHREMGNTARAAYFAEQLTIKYNGSKFMKLATDPTYAAQLLRGENELVRAYEAAYGAFEQGNYEQAHNMAVKGRAELLARHPLKARYALLLAMTTGHTQGRQAYINALRQVVSQFNDTPEQLRAKEILRLLGESGARVPGRPGLAGGGGGGFRESMKELHYMMVVFRDKDVTLSEAKIKVAGFNSKYNKADRLRVTNVYLGDNNSIPVLILRRFKDGEAAMAYLRNARDREAEFLDPAQFDYEIYPVSQSNYREVLKIRTVDGYKEWFEENY